MLLMLLTSLALGQDPAPEPPRWDPGERDWEAVDRRARTVYTAGGVTALAGLGLGIAGTLAPSDELLVVGGLGEAVGAPIMAASSLRSRRALVEQGAKLPATAGALAWALWGSSLVATGTSNALLEQGEEDAAAGAILGALVLRIGSYAAAGLQAGANRRARARLPAKEAP